ncbi:mitochondrial distribution and morphology [Dimargaris cristalligena]|nr:mitochondrial distribution and morphology [Dimargaris cristalligena]
MSDERKLKPVYDALESWSYQKAITHCDRLLKFEPQFLMAKALKAQALARLDRLAEADTLAQEIRAAHPTDVVVLNNLALLYRNLDKKADAVAVYEEAIPHASRAKLEPICIQWFMACVRTGAHSLQHKAAVKINHLFKKKQYVMWTIMSLLTQAYDRTTPDAQRKLFFTLAERMLQKSEESGDLDTAEGLWAYLQFLEEHGQFGRGLAILAKPRWQTPMDLDPMLLDRKLHFHLCHGEFQSARELAEDRLQTGCEDWQYYQILVDALVGALRAQLDSASPVVETAVAETTATWQAFFEKRPTSRAALLAQLEFYHQLSQLAQVRASDAQPSRIGTLIHAYVSEMGTRPSAFDDIKKYLGSLEGADREALIAAMRGSFEKADRQVRSPFQKDTPLREYLNHVKVYLTRYSEHDPSAHVSGLHVCHSLAQAFGQRPAAPKDGHGDDLANFDDCLLLAAQMLAFRAFSASPVDQQEAFIYAALMLLETGVQASPDNFHFKLLAVRLYAHAGEFQRAQSLYRTLSIKHVQHDTLSYWVTGLGHVVGHYTEEVRLGYDGLTIYDSNQVETPDMLALALRNGAYSQIRDFLEFQRRLADSLHRRVLLTTTLRSEFVSMGSLEDLLDMLKHAELHDFPYAVAQTVDVFADNRDFTVLPFPGDEVEAATLEFRTRPDTTGSGAEYRTVALAMHILHHLACYHVDQLGPLVSELDSLIPARSGPTPPCYAGSFWFVRLVCDLGRVVAEVYAAFRADPPTAAPFPREGLAERLLSVLDLPRALTQALSDWGTQSPVMTPTLREASALVELCNTIALVLKVLKEYQPNPADAGPYQSLVNEFSRGAQFCFEEAARRCRQVYEGVSAPEFQARLLRRMAGSNEVAGILTAAGVTGPTTVSTHLLSSWQASLENSAREVERRLGYF